ncbi:DUF167 domain-containing protein [Paracraurococcus lichenis]|uniref:UPF0235 protein Q7A36_18970 n=1 Tax=Paracraurococcus lichenis TaxID=3064888 RepID=A0ABT9E2R8_9PROT|nr:DUF167 family protein [Paracraurococcus sp. LOR1-02]MDO9710444.1 DUF167 family protein [Paracraurococcus sp. LOR1-02]
MTAAWWRAEAAGVAVRVKVQPRARRAGLLGLAPGADGPRLKLAVTEAPEDGRANRAVCAALARALGVAPSAAEVAQGAAAREKLIFVAGDPTALASRLETLA